MANTDIHAPNRTVTFQRHLTVAKPTANMASTAYGLSTWELSSCPPMGNVSFYHVFRQHCGRYRKHIQGSGTLGEFFHLQGVGTQLTCVEVKKPDWGLTSGLFGVLDGSVSPLSSICIP